MPKVLMVAYYFPPAGGAGVQRTLKFVKYLPDFGWTPIVLTISKRLIRLFDMTMEREIPLQVKVDRTRTVLIPQRLPWRFRNWISRWIFTVDEQLGWMPFAIPRARQLIKQEDISVIYTTSSPYTDHVIGYYLKKDTGKPWIADFRDPWLGNINTNIPTRAHRRILERLEQRVLHQANQIIVVSEPMRQSMLSQHPDIDPVKVVTIPNGFDSADFTAIEPAQSDPDRLVIVYSGSFYTKHRSPEVFLEALQAAIVSDAIPRHEIKVYFVGNLNKNAQEKVQQLGLTDVVVFSGYVPHSESISYLLSADLLLLIISSGAESQIVLTGKLFEYLAARKPILALVPAGAAAELIQEAQAGQIVPPEDTKLIMQALIQYHSKWKQGQLTIRVDGQVVSRYERRNLTLQLAGILDQVAVGGPL